MNASSQTNQVPAEAEALTQHLNKEISIHGFVYKIRKMSGFSFVILRTKRALVQCVHSPGYTEFPVEVLKENMSVIFFGKVAAEARSQMGLEIRLKKCEILSAPVAGAPVVINKNSVEASLDTLIDLRPVTLRNVRERAIFKIQEGICRGIRDFLYHNHFTEIHSPKIVFSGAESGSDQFRLDYFGRKAFLTQSPQFYKQMMTGVFERVFEIGPVYRAEKHNTSRHLSEYTSVDLEMGFVSTLRDIMRLEADMLSHTLAFLSEAYAQELTIWGPDYLPSVANIPEIPFAQAKEMVSKTYAREITDGDDFEPEEERLLSELMKKLTGSDFTFVTRYKSSKRPFYAKDCADDPTVTDSFDLIFRGLEITTGGLRIHDYDQQVAKMRAREMNPEDFQHYLLAHKTGLPPHGGLGLGLERFTARLLKLPNVRYATLFPRDTGRLEP
ncbi:MAG: aspartate--tRNA(Asn) ligase [Clostridiales bacterium]|jgi:nondiscriminating aspartyl-tRNA synthetase|nr:aspartate--tRNA(Asn) ligase [Clostridiales bacterium]